MKIGIGTCIYVKTKTKDDVFGECYYEITGPTIVQDGKEITKCVMLGGSGKAAKPGFVVWDNLDVIAENVKSGITKIVDPATAKKVADGFNNKKGGGSIGGCMEFS